MKQGKRNDDRDALYHWLHEDDGDGPGCVSALASFSWTCLALLLIIAGVAIGWNGGHALLLGVACVLIGLARW